MSEIDSLERPVADELTLTIDSDDLGEINSTESGKDSPGPVMAAPADPGPVMDASVEPGLVMDTPAETGPAVDPQTEIEPSVGSQPAQKSVLVFQQKQDIRTLPGYKPKTDAQLEAEREAAEKYSREVRLRSEQNRQAWRSKGHSRSKSVGISEPARPFQNSFTEPDSGVSSSSEVAPPLPSQKRPARVPPKIKSVVIVPEKKAKNAPRKPSPMRQPVIRTFENTASQPQRLQIQVPIPAGARGVSTRTIVVPPGASMNVTVKSPHPPAQPSLGERLKELFPEFNVENGSTLAEAIVEAAKNGDPDRVTEAIERAVAKSAMPKRNGVFVTSRAANQVCKALSHELLTTLQSCVSDLDNADFHNTAAWTTIKDYAKKLFDPASEYRFCANAVLLSSKESLKSFMERTKSKDNAQN